MNTDDSELIFYALPIFHIIILLVSIYNQLFKKLLPLSQILINYTKYMSKEF